jgi:hypothetical protein
MSRSLIVGTFARGEDLVAATRAARHAGLAIVDAYTPFAVHGLDDAMGLPPSRLSWVCLVAGLTGAALKLWFEVWTAVVDWPLNVGGKPDNSLPAFVPITFEVMVLFAGLATVAALFAVARLWPGRRAQVPVAGVTDDRFALVVEETGAGSGGRIRSLFEQHQAIGVSERIADGRQRWRG